MGIFHLMEESRVFVSIFKLYFPSPRQFFQSSPSFKICHGFYSTLQLVSTLSVHCFSISSQRASFSAPLFFLPHSSKRFFIPLPDFNLQKFNFLNKNKSIFSIRTKLLIPLTSKLLHHLSKRSLNLTSLNHIFSYLNSKGLLGGDPPSKHTGNDPRLASTSSFDQFFQSTPPNPQRLETYRI